MKTVNRGTKENQEETRRVSRFWVRSGGGYEAGRALVWQLYVSPTWVNELKMNVPTLQPQMTPKAFGTGHATQRSYK
jgi:hypothetical protein